MKFLRKSSPEIRQEAVKAALAMCSNQKQPVVFASKRHTAYNLQPSTPQRSAYGAQAVSDHASSTENPFPVSHIKNGAAIASSSAKNFRNAPNAAVDPLLSGERWNKLSMRVDYTFFARNFKV